MGTSSVMYATRKNVARRRRARAQEICVQQKSLCAMGQGVGVVEASHAPPGSHHVAGKDAEKEMPSRPRPAMFESGGADECLFYGERIC